MSDAKIIMPKSLTAENGAKGLLSGEFKELVDVPCFECLSEGLNDDCIECCGTGLLSQSVTVSWTTIKQIYTMVAKHLGQPNPTTLEE